MGELVNAADSKSAVHKDVQVRFLFRHGLNIRNLDITHFQGFFIFIGKVVGEVLNLKTF